MAERVAARHEIRLAAKTACASVNRTASANGLLERCLVAMAEGALLSDDGSVRTAGFANLARRLKQMAKMVDRFPKLWERVKDFLGVESLTDLPGRIVELAKEGYKALRKAVDKAFSVWPLKLYTLPESKLFSLNTALEKLMDASPAFKQFLTDNVKPHVDQFDRWLKDNLPVVSKVVMVAIYLWIWINVFEFEWDFKGLIDAATGVISLADLLASLPGSVLGALLNPLGIGYAIIPVTIAIRILLVISRRYITWTGSGFTFDAEKLRADFGMDPATEALIPAKV